MQMHFYTLGVVYLPNSTTLLKELQLLNIKMSTQSRNVPMFTKGEFSPCGRVGRWTHGSRLVGRCAEGNAGERLERQPSEYTVGQSGIVLPFSICPAGSL